MIEPGAIFEVPPHLAEPPQVAAQEGAPVRLSRWVLIVSNKADCRDRYHETVTVVLLSAQPEYGGRHDVFIPRPVGGLERDSIAQTDLVFVILKAELTDDRYRGKVLSDTLVQVRAKLSETLGFPGPSGS